MHVIYLLCWKQIPSKVISKTGDWDKLTHAFRLSMTLWYHFNYVMCTEPLNFVAPQVCQQKIVTLTNWSHLEFFVKRLFIASGVGAYITQVPYSFLLTLFHSAITQIWVSAWNCSVVVCCWSVSISANPSAKMWRFKGQPGMVIFQKSNRDIW